MFNYKGGELYCEEIKVADIIRETGTPCFIYSSNNIIRNYLQIKEAFSDVFDCLICYSVKANSNLSILKLLKDLGSGFDVASGGELFRVMKIEAEPEKIVFAGAGKTPQEISMAVKAGILSINVESYQELEIINNISAEEKKISRVSLRLNPDVFAFTHPYITTGIYTTKFGISFEDTIEIIKSHKRFKNVKIVGVHMHIGSQITRVEPYILALQKIMELAEQARHLGVEFEYINIGGGFGIKYKDEEPLNIKQLAGALAPVLRDSGCRILLEPGRFIIADAGILVTRVLYTKQIDKKNFVICDTGMHHLIRPVMYDAYHAILPVKSCGRYIIADIVGPLCESSDLLAKDREVEVSGPGDLLAIFNAGAYGYSMSSTYNSQPLPCQVMVNKDRYFIISRRQTYADLISYEQIVDIY